VSPAPGLLHPDHRKGVQLTVRSNALIESTNTKIRLITRIAFGFKSPDALIALALLSLGGHRPALPGRNPPTDASGEPHNRVDWPGNALD
jgi:Transposase